VAEFAQLAVPLAADRACCLLQKRGRALALPHVDCPIGEKPARLARQALAKVLDSPARLAQTG
jgi:hypothetical protein